MNTLKRKIIFLVCYMNRNLRYGNSTNRFYQFFVIRTRTLLKKYIKSNSGYIDNIGEVKINLKYAGKMNLFTNDYIDKWLFTGADFEPRTVEIIKKYLSEKGNFLDIGANIGYFSLIASRRIGKEGTVYAFEPTPNTISRLKKNISLNNLCNIEVIEKAVSNKAGIVIFKTPSASIRNSGRSSMRDIEEHYITLNVETVTIDSMLNSFKKISLIKMDIEGAEGLALEGMEGLINRDRPVIIMELSDKYLKQMGYSGELVLAFLRDKKYKVYDVCDLANELMNNKPDVQYDILCIPMQ